MANNGIFYSSGNTLNFTTNSTTWATLTSGGTFVMNAVSGGTYLNLPSTTFTGGTVSGTTNFTGGLTANTISATTYLNLPYSGTVNGSGTTNYVSKWTGSTGLGDSQIYDDGTFVGIGTTAKTFNEVLNVYGNGGIRNNTINFVGHTSFSIAIADGDYSNWGSGGNEIAIGGGQPLLNSTGEYNISIGYGALPDNTTGFENVAIGNDSLNVNTTGGENISIGHGTLSSNQAGQGNVALGYYAGSGITSGSYNIFLGYKAGGNETTGENKLFISNTNEKTLIYGEFVNNKVGINTTTPIAALDVSGGTRIEGSLTANTISATTYYNLPVSGLTSGTGIQVSGSNGNYTISFTGSTTGGTSGDYLPLSGGTLTGGLVANSGVTASTISQTSYIDFTTGSTNPSQSGGRVFFDNDSKALSYYGLDNDLLPVAMGQQLYERVYNATGVQIDKGKVIAITGTSNSLPSAILAVNNHSLGSPRPIGVAAENIPNGVEGLVITNGILSGITINTFANGATLYLSDTIPGGYVDSTTSLVFSARTNEIGYVIQTGTTTGKIYVNINNEDSNLTLTDIERNILEGNVISSGVYEYTGMTSASTTTVNIAPIRGWIVKNTYEFATLPDVTNLYYTGGTGITITNISSADATYVLINSASTIYQQTTFPTPQQRRENIFLGKVVHPNRTSILSVNNTVDFDVSPMSALRDLWTPLKLINEGIVPSANGANLSINTSGGVLWGNGIGWVTNQLNPDSVTISGKSPASFFYRTQTGGTSGAVSVIDPTKYDVGGVITSVGGAGSDDSTNQRIYMYPTGIINILYGQQRYNNLAAAIAGIQSETFITYPNAASTGILIGILSVRNDIVADGEPLTNTNYAKFTFVSKFGELLGGTGGISTTTLQQAYDNSSTPEIVINSTLDGLTIQNGTGNADNITNLFEGKSSSSGTTSFIRADGAFSGTSIYGTGLSATTVNISSLTGGPSINNLGIDSSGNVVIGSSGGGSTFTGGTVTGPTSFTNGLTANTISATTYQNLPQSVSGAGTTNYIPKWTGSTGLGNSQLQDDGSQVYTNQGYGSPLTGNLSINASGTTGIAGRATQYGIYGAISGTTSSSAGVYGEATIGQYGVYGLNQGDAPGTYTGVYGVAQQANEAFAGSIFIGGRFKGDPVTGAGYSLWLEDGTEGIGKVLVSQTSDGKANWNTFSGINITITSAATNTLVFSAATGGGGGAVSSVTAGSGLSGNSTTGAIDIINTDKGSSQNIFKNIQVNGATQFSAGSNSSNLNFSGINITITSAATNTLVFSAATGGGGGVTQIIAGTNITISPPGGTGAVTINSTGSGGTSSVNLGTVYTTANNFNFL
jgi:hypothetical protein